MNGGFDFDKLVDDPIFAAGVGLLGGASPSMNPLLGAYKLMQQGAQAKREREQAAAMMEHRKAQLGLQERQVLQGDRQLELQGAENASQAEYRASQAKAADALAASRQRDAELRERELKIQEDWNNYIKALAAAKTGKGPMPVAPGMQPSMQPQSGQAPTGKFGTPVSILDGLMKAESNGNPFAIGPDIGGGKRAKGAYQFLDDTVAMLEPEFGKFSPFDPVASRDAADFYLQKLYKQHGSWEGALAAYGGFKNKDAAPYIQKVMSGSPESVVRQHTQNQNNPAFMMPSLEPSYTTDLKLGPKGGTIEINETYEPAKLQLDAVKTAQEYGPGGYKSREAARQDTETDIKLRQERRAEEKHPGELAQQAATVESTQANARQSEAAAERARQQAAADAGKAYQAHQSLSLNLDQMYDTAKRLKEHKGLDRVTGLASYVPPALLGADARNAAAEKKHLEGQIFTNASQAFRRMNETGGSVGQQSDWEGKQFVTAWARLDAAQDPKAYREALDSLMVSLREAQLRMQAAYDYYHGKKKGEVSPQQFKRITRTGKKDGKRVVQFEDGSIDTID